MVVGLFWLLNDEYLVFGKHVSDHFLQVSLLFRGHVADVAILKHLNGILDILQLGPGFCLRN